MENIIDYTKIGERVRDARLKKGLSQEKLAELTDMSSSHISHIENASSKIGLPAIVRVANALDVTVDSILQDNSEVSFNAYMDALSVIIRDSDDKTCSAIVDIAKRIYDLDRDAI